ncbi:hypothetical protein M422DRAFT_265518 [Sphaerobolus stellatus SS14]|uniref:Helitron helicase-like domain-containing protein n=1 Tax=Sphaerobolus stellatus (strain SS14) TaxID=990650 RepID=A0A0C9V5D2_SPHS4|nr:hypothetical protein M422DRAFT_265518 [Sphaerobolus stellatus SS14]
MTNAPIIAKKISAYSRRLNNLFAFTAIGATGHFQHFHSGVHSVAITGHTYHRMLDASTPEHSIHWFIYDEAERESSAYAQKVPTIWVQAVKADLDTVNPYVDHLRLFQNLDMFSASAIELTDASSNGDFAAIIHVNSIPNIQPCSILIWRNNHEQPSFISIYSCHYEPLQYPLLFPHGSLGWDLVVSREGIPTQDGCQKFMQCQWYRSRLLTDDHFLYFGRLPSEYIVDIYSQIEEQELSYILHSQSSDQGKKNTELPASFLGSCCWSSENTADGLAIARLAGRPTFFITITCNPNWPEIKARLAPGKSAADAPVIVTRVFKIRLQRFMQRLRKKFGKLIYMIKVIEFQF